MTEEPWGDVQVGEGDSPGWRDRILGTPGRLGWWTFPLFVGVGLVGALLAGSLAAVYYAGQVSALKRETEAARNELNSAVGEVNAVASEAVGTIEGRVNEVQDALAVRPPLEDAATVGVVAVRAEATRQPAATPRPGPGGTEPPAPPPAPVTETRRGSGFAVVQSDEATFFVTAFSVVADPDRPDVPIEQATVLLGGNEVRATVHSWDAERDLALLRVPGNAGVELLTWRPAEEVLAPGNRLFASGVAPNGTFAQLGAEVGAVDLAGVTLGVGVPAFVRGGPLTDGQGRVVGIVTTAYQPYGRSDAGLVSAPVRALCEGLVRCAANDLPAG